MTNLEKLNIIRDNDRITFDDILSKMFTNNIELHGDRSFADDRAIYCGLGNLNGQNVCIIGQRKGYNTTTNLEYNFGMPKPEGFRKVKRVINLAQKFNIPVITFIDTPGAYPGIESEERGQGQAIADMLYTLSDLSVPIISIIISEGGSGGALALGVSDYIYGLENCYYSVISPEGYAEILYKGKKQVSDIIEDMPIFIDDLRKLKIVDSKVTEPKNGATRFNCDSLIHKLGLDINKKINKLIDTHSDILIEKRYKRYRRFGEICTLK